MLPTAISKDDFADQESQLIFETRKNFYQTGDWNYVLETIAGTYYQIWDKILSKTSKSAVLCETLRSQQGQAVIFGAGQTGKTTFYSCYPIFQDRIIGFVDNHKHGTTYCGLPVYSVENLLTYPKENLPIVLIPEGIYALEMQEQLNSYHYSPSKVYIIPNEFFFQSFKDMSNIDIKNVLLTPTNHFILYGTTHLESLISFLLKVTGRHLVGVCDPTYTETFFHEVPVISLDKAKKQGSDCFILCQQERIPEAVANGICREQLVPMFYIDHLQYFDPEIVPKPDKTPQSFIDGGAYDLQTAMSFLSWCNGNVESIYSFEPDQSNYKVCLNILDAGKFIYNSKDLSEKVRLYKKGLWNSSTVLSFQETEVSGAAHVGTLSHDISDVRNTYIVQINCCSIDEVVGNNNITFIKMDVEGSELEALKGAAKTIRRCRPILAISVYHKPEDIIEIPSYIKSLIPEYRLFLRCYHTDHTETILYAI